jgi:hypothetical protein
VNKRKVALAAAAIVCAFAVVSPPLKMDACSIDVEPAFTIRTRPDFPVRNYLAGQLGILQPSYYRMYLVVAYRYLNEAPLSVDEQKILQEKWEPERKSEAEVMHARPEVGPVQVWTNAVSDALGGRREAVGFDAFGIETYRRFGTTQINFYNCLPDAFATATKRLRAYEDKFGAKSQEVRDWIEAQEKVFNNCSEYRPYGGPRPDLPSELTKNAPAEVQADREYQIAAAYFYAGRYSEARQRFEKIATDSNSQWHGIAPLLAGRAVLREATINDGNEGNNDTELADAETIFRKVVNDPSQPEYHSAGQRLLNFAEVRLHPREELRRLSEKLAKNDGKDLIEDLTDYTSLMDRVPYKEKDKSAGDNLTDWIFTLQGAGGDVLAHSLTRWKETRSDVWLVAVLAWMHAPNPQLDDVLAAAQKVPSSSPAYSMATFHRLRLEYEAGGGEHVRTELDALLREHGAQFSISTINQMKALRMRMARNLDEFLAFAPRKAAATEIDGAPEPWDAKDFWHGGQQSDVLFDQDGAYALNRFLPLATLVRAAQSASVPAALRPQVALAAWVRAVILDDEKAANEAAHACEQLVPEMKAALEQYEQAPDTKEKKFAAIFVMLHFPGAQIEVHSGPLRGMAASEMDSFRDNWWGAAADSPGFGGAKPGALANGSPLSSVYPDQNLHPPSFVSADEEATAREQWNKISSAPAPNFFASVVLDWAKAHPDDGRVPEALHLVVRATRYGNGDKDTGEYSKAAFDLLHNRYPNSEWAKKTPYWFND